jgi:hypothetical protein
MPPTSPEGKFKSQAQKFQPRKVEPMPSVSPSATGQSSAQPKGGWTGKGIKIPNESLSVAPTVTSTSSPRANAASNPTTSPAEKLTKQEKKEQKREEKKELKRERKEGFESTSPSPSP